MLLDFADVGPGPVIVLLHGFPLDRMMWSHQQTTIGSEYRVIAPDLRGQGGTSAPGGIYPIDDMADDVIETLDTLRITEPIVLGGLSMGGYVALSIAVRNPKRLRGLMLMDTRATADAPEVAANRETLAQAVEAANSVDSLVDSMLPRLFSPTTRRDRPEVIDQAEARMRATPPRGAAGALRGMAARPDRTRDLGRIAVPTLVLSGEDDTLTTPDVARAMAAAIPDARFVAIPDAGHLPPLENPAATSAAILKFLSSLA